MINEHFINSVGNRIVSTSEETINDYISNKIANLRILLLFQICYRRFSKTMKSARSSSIETIGSSLKLLEICSPNIVQHLCRNIESIYG